MVRINALCLIIFGFLLSCSNNEINTKKSREDIVSKNIFNSNYLKKNLSDEEWYYRMSVIDAPVNTEALTIAEGHLFHPDTIRWEITENVLVAWRANATVLGGEQEEDQPANYRGAPVLAFPIIAHLDTNNEKNANLLPWHERPFIKIDWSNNVVNKIYTNDAYEDGTKVPLKTLSQYYVDQSWIAHPNRARFYKNYLEITSRHPVPASPKSRSGKYGSAYENDGAAPVIDIRHSFLKKKINNNFLPLAYPDFVIGKTQNGKIENIDINNRFGFFRTGYYGKPVYNKVTGKINSHGIANATIFNIWKNSFDEKGKVLPLAHREIKPIIYYSNILHPNKLLSVSANAIEQWNKVFKEAVFYAQPKKYKVIGDVPNIIIFKENSCNIKNINKIFKDLKLSQVDDIEAIAKTSLKKINHLFEKADNDKDFSISMANEISAKRKLEQICSALEFFSSQFGDDAFIYQRAGDLRFNLINLLVENNTTGWSGYGPMFADELSGETISATANINLKYIDLKAQQINKMISSVNQQKEISDIFLHGFSAKDSVVANSLDEEAVAEFRREFFSNNSNNNSLDYKALKNSEIAAFLENNISNLKEHQSSPKKNVKNQLMDELKYVDQIAIGLVVKYLDTPFELRFDLIRAHIFEAVLLHELGHNFGLKHNMAASLDALNYGEKFWWMQRLPENLPAALLFSTDAKQRQDLEKCLKNQERINYLDHEKELSTQDCLRQKSAMYSSIMDYHASSLADLNGLGLYDKAAIKWAYTQQIEVFPKNNLRIDFEKNDLAKWLKYNNFNHIPKSFLSSYTAIHERNHQSFSWTNYIALNDFPKNAVPYRYCDNSNSLMDPQCSAFDFGPSPSFSASWLKNRFWQQYLFTHFTHGKDRLNNDDLGVKNDIDIMESLSKIAFWYQYNVKNDSNFIGSYLEKEYLKAVAISLNLFAQIIGMPEQGEYISAPRWKLSGNNANFDDLLQPTKLLVPIHQLTKCEVSSVLALSNSSSHEYLYENIKIPLGLGQPYKNKKYESVEEENILYSGSSISKKLAIYYLLAPIMPKNLTNAERSDLANTSWYNIFPEAVRKILNAIILQKNGELGLLFDNGRLKSRNIIDETTLKIIEANKNEITVMPASDIFLVEFSLETAHLLLSKERSLNDKWIESLNIRQGSCNENYSFGPQSDTKLVKYADQYGFCYSALDFDEALSVGARILANAGEIKDRINRLEYCQKNLDDAKNDPLCQCVKTEHRFDFNNWKCCGPKNPQCQKPELESPGNESCSLSELKKKTLQAYGELKKMETLIHKSRHLSSLVNK